MVASKVKIGVTCACGCVSTISLKTLRRRWSGRPWRCLTCANNDPLTAGTRREKCAARMQLPENRFKIRDIAASPAIRSTLSKRVENAWASGKMAGVAAKIRARKNDPEWNAADRKTRSAPEFVAKMSAAITEAFKDPAKKARHAASMRTDETRRKLSETSTRTNACPLLRERRRQIALKLAKDPAWLLKTAVASRLKQAANGFVSSIQRRLYTFLDDLGVTYHKEGERTTIGPYVFDCLVEYGGKNMLIEVQGDYWHAQAKAIQRDKSKFTYISRYFPEYEISYVWEKEFLAKDRVLDRIKLKLGIQIETVDFDFSSVTVVPCTSAVASEFVDSYHYLGRGRSKLSVCARIGEKVVAVCVFGQPIRQVIGGMDQCDCIEITRLAIHPSYHKKNFASWFVSRCVKMVDRPVVAFADTTVAHIGTTYKAAGFELHHETDADYWYIDKENYAWHKKTVWKHANKMGMTESAWVAQEGLVKRFGGKKMCYVCRWHLVRKGRSDVVLG